MKMRNTPHGVTFTTDTGLDIDVVLIGGHNGREFLCVSTPHRRVDLSISTKGHSIRHWAVSSPMTAGMLTHKVREAGR